MDYQVASPCPYLNNREKLDTRLKDDVSRPLVLRYRPVQPRGMISCSGWPVLTIYCMSLTWLSCLVRKGMRPNTSLPFIMTTCNYGAADPSILDMQAVA
jgi:hypothetical protein